MEVESQITIILERMAIQETIMKEHLRSCERKYDRDFKIQIAILGVLLTVLATNLVDRFGAVGL